MTTKKKPPRLEAIRWLDHCTFGDPGWKATSSVVENLKPLAVVSVGYIAHETPEYITLISSVTADGEGCFNEMCIMKPAIIARRRLSEATRKPRG